MKQKGYEAYAGSTKPPRIARQAHASAGYFVKGTLFEELLVGCP